MKPYRTLMLPALYLLLSSVCYATDWQLRWAEEFDRPGLPDPAKFGYETGFIRNNELQFYTEGRAENARATNGVLTIEGRKERYRNPSFNPASARSGRRSSVEFADYTAAS